MKEYINERIASIRGEKEFWLTKLEQDERNDYYRNNYLTNVRLLEELLELQAVAMKEGVK